MKICNTCRVELPLSKFYKERGMCRPCRAALVRVQYAANPERHAVFTAAWAAANPEKKAVYDLQARYGLTPAERDVMFVAQGGLCAIRGCGNPATEVDHCHPCEDIDRHGSVRGLLCHGCNMGIERRANLTPPLAAYKAQHAATCPQ